MPFSPFFAKVNRKLSCPIPAMILAAVLCIAFGAISLGSKTAFADLVGSFIILTTTSYACAIAPHLLTGRKNVPPGPFWMGKAGFFVQGATVIMIIFFNIMFCFRKFPCSLAILRPNANYILSIRNACRCPNYELQQCHSGWMFVSHHSLVVHPRTAKLSWSQVGGHVH